jgi:hypothetical protein
VDILAPVRRVRIIDQYDSKDFMYGMLMENGKQRPEEWCTMIFIA